MFNTSKDFLRFVLLFFIALILSAGIGFYVYKNGQVKINSSENIASPTPSVFTEPDIEINNEIIKHKLGSIEFQTPKNFYIKYGKNDTYPIEWYDIDSNWNLNLSENIPTFTIRVDRENKSLSEKEEELIKTWHLLDVNKKTVSIAETEGVLVMGRVNPKNNYNSRFADNAKVKIVLFVKDGEVYQLIGNTTDSNNEWIFDQILSTFKFIDNELSDKVKGCIGKTKCLGPAGTNVMCANPASIFCECMGGIGEIKENEGGQYGICKIDGKEHNEWEYFRKMNPDQRI